MAHQIILYGANGYTGQLILDEILKQQLPEPLLAGRNEKAIRLLADRYHLDFAVATTSEISALLKKEKGVKVVINAAGPFIDTALPVAKACIAKGIQYLDITGEISVFQQLMQLNEQAKESGVMLLPGAGFDVVPTDCLALALKQEMPEAESLVLAFAGLGGGSSRGTSLTAIRQLDSHTWVREEGELKAISWRSRTKKIDFGPFKATCLPIPWGDLQTAWYSTGIKNIMVYMPFSKQVRKWLPLASRIAQLKPVNKLLQVFISKKITGPTVAQRERAQTHIIGEVAAGDKILRKHLSTPDGYTFTALSVAVITRRILKGDYKTGYQTPATAYGVELLKDIKGVSWLSR